MKFLNNFLLSVSLCSAAVLPANQPTGERQPATPSTSQQGTTTGEQGAQLGDKGSGVLVVAAGDFAKKGSGQEGQLGAGDEGKKAEKKSFVVVAGTMGGAGEEQRCGQGIKPDWQQGTSQQQIPTLQNPVQRVLPVQQAPFQQGVMQEVPFQRVPTERFQGFQGMQGPQGSQGSYGMQGLLSRGTPMQQVPVTQGFSGSYGQQGFQGGQGLQWNQGLSGERGFGQQDYPGSYSEQVGQIWT